MFKDTAESFAQNDVQNISVDTKSEPVSPTKKAATPSLASFLSQLPDVVCLSHLRWDFVYQRPQHLLSRFARHSRVFFVEEPIFEHVEEPYLDTASRGENITLAVPHLPHGLEPQRIEEVQRELLVQLFAEHAIEQPILWYYTPMALSFSEHLQPALTVYDCMDELSAFKFAPARLKDLEQQLFQKADLVFTGGQSLYEAKKEQHPAIKAFPSSIDKAHFAKAKEALPVPADQAAIPEPRLGFFGVIDERMDLDLLAEIADAKPEWQLVMIGPVVKIDPASLPQRENIHYLGGKSYQELPAYLSSWQVALLPFAINESTAFISPTKTPEYLAAGKPVVSTPIRDVVRPYGEEVLVHIAATAPEFVQAVEAALLQQDDKVWQQKVQDFMGNMSWDQTWQSMVALMLHAMQQRNL
ncbi:glycosyltransferase family 1 protein [Pontibacter akesuensis]|uniref:Glycosyltransferase involved in cell wall bisynthesis n=1 Tax=Pontibacter akesuensis TaxID=388950 RepID=A0A1I7KTU3_9BACT|nr:glycosyltransferase family 1 protein [Pontibacter akesuensis]GHA80652.1 glycosyl transferase [Pontibacter akesuensis]SFV00827.1 Glycosyltransferase involved in cell wall bisynthesis [Pontibacter akesuensis]